MNKKLWLFIISFWIACLIAGLCTYFYIYSSQKQVREQFISEFKYNYETEIQEGNHSSPIVQYDAQLFLKEIQQVLEKMNQYEEKISTMVNKNGQLQSNLDYILTAYQQSKWIKQQFTNVEITNSSFLQKKQFEKIADATVDYLHASSIYYIISAKKMMHSTSFLEQQYETAQNTLSTSKSHLNMIIELNSEND